MLVLDHQRPDQIWGWRSFSTNPLLALEQRKAHNLAVVSLPQGWGTLCPVMNDTEILESEARIESWAHHLLAVHPWASCLIYFHSSQAVFECTKINCIPHSVIESIQGSHENSVVGYKERAIQIHRLMIFCLGQPSFINSKQVWLNLDYSGKGNKT